MRGWSIAVVAAVASSGGTLGAMAPDLHRAARASGCSMQHLASCSTTNALIRQKGFDTTLDAFLGRAAKNRVGYLYRGTLGAQVDEVLGGPPDDRRDLPDGGHLFTACRPHSCTEKGAVAFDADGKVVAVAVLSFHCGMAAKRCSDDPFLDIYKRGDRRSSIARQAIRDWALTALREDAAARHGSIGRPILHRLPL